MLSGVAVLVGLAVDVRVLAGVQVGVGLAADVRVAVDVGAMGVGATPLPTNGRKVPWSERAAGRMDGPAQRSKLRNRVMPNAVEKNSSKCLLLIRLTIS